jgi:hypothetical protein
MLEESSKVVCSDLELLESLKSPLIVQEEI